MHLRTGGNYALSLRGRFERRPAGQPGGIVAIDGCPIGCAKVTVEHGGFPVTDYIMVTGLGIRKKHEFAWTDEELDRVVQAVKESLES
ncbi:MAG: hypothetical protein IMW95_11660 [Moorella humiferrea]|nr:hypothetical protein [Moorella humiferrea]